MQNPRAHFVVDLGGDRFDVIAGYKLNEVPLTLAEANVLARRSSCSVVSVIGQLMPPYTQPTRAPFAGNDEHDRRRRREMS